MENGDRFSDVTLVTGDGKKIKAHRAILSARCTFFEKMFSIEMLEKDKTEIEILDIEFEMLEKVVEFIYSGTVQNLNKFAFELLPVADKVNIFCFN